jgi:hypothetical protein
MLAKVGIVTATIFCFVSSTNAAPTDEKKIVQVLISPSCKDMFYGPDFIDLDTNGNPKKDQEKRLKPDYVPWDPARAKPMAYRDPRTSITFYVESDGRHLAAISEAGELIWLRNPWEDKPAFCPYRTPRPIISHIESIEFNEVYANNLKSRGVNLSHTFLSIQFDSSQYGVIDESSGDFIPEGQN